MERKATIERDTLETKIKLQLNIDGIGYSHISTKVGFFDHMLVNMSKHGFFDIDLVADGDIEVDCHHTIEDVGIVIGQGIHKALGDKIGIKRYGQSIIPMEEALILCSLDISGRPYVNFDGNFTVPIVGDMQTEMVEEFFRAIAINCGLNLHIKILEGKNNHHMIEGIFKAFGKALDEATSIDPRIKGVLSTKGRI